VAGATGRTGGEVGYELLPSLAVPIHPWLHATQAFFAPLKAWAYQKALHTTDANFCMCFCGCFPAEVLEAAVIRSQRRWFGGSMQQRSDKN